MAGNVKSIPDNYHSITPYLITKGAAAAIDFYTQASGRLSCSECRRQTDA
jgi:hypothetical protein